MFYCIGLALCFGQPVDSALLKLVNTEVGELRESVRLWKEDVEINQVHPFIIRYTLCYIGPKKKEFIEEKYFR